MKLMDQLKDEQLGCALLYNFTKGYQRPVPMAVYDYVLPLIFNDTFRGNILKADSYMKCVNMTLNTNPSIFDEINVHFEEYQALTNRTLGLAVIQKLIAFHVEENGVCGTILDSKVLDFNEVIKLGEWFSKMSLEAIKESFEIHSKLVVILDTITLGKDVSLEQFTKFGRVEMYENTTQEELFDRVKDANYILTNKVVLNQTILSQLPKLEYIGILATGTNNVDLEYCKENNIKVQNVEDYSSISVAQHTFSLLLYLYEKMSYYDEYVKSGEYIKSDSFTHFGMPFNQLSGKTWGIVGLGKIGKEVAKIAEAFGCKVIYYSTSGKNFNDTYTQVTFEELLRTSDIISIHAPLNEQTHYLFNHKAFALMKRNAYLINVGRGPIVNEEDLAFALKHKLIAGAGIDVLEHEPMLKNNPLYEIKDSTRLVITPHIAWASEEARALLIEKAYNHLLDFVKENS